MNRRRQAAGIALMVTMAALAAARIADAHPVDDPMTGIASWYGEPHHGRLTANGEIFDQEALTAAHPSLPFGTILRVTNLHNGLSVEVRISDRGPVIPGRIVDLSRAAARSVRATGLGIFRVRLEVVPRETPTTAAMRDASARRTTTEPGVRERVRRAAVDQPATAGRARVVQTRPLTVSPKP